MGSFNHLAIYLTERCNLACRYCYVNKDYSSTLNFPTIKKAIDLFCNNSSKDRTFTFMGGEPLLVHPHLIKTIDYIINCSKKYNFAPYFFLFTNGTKLTSWKVQNLDRRGVKIIVSLDGGAATNDCFRRFAKKTYNSVFDVVMKRLKTIPYNYLKKFEVNMVVTPHTCYALMKNIKLFYKEGISIITPSISAYSQWSNHAYKILESQLWELAKFYTSLFQKKQPLFKITPLAGFVKGSCEQMSSCNRLTLGSDGNFYFCDAFLSVSKNKRLNYKISSVKEATVDSLLKWINNCKKSSEGELRKISPSRIFLLHKANLAIYCPFGVYHYAKVNGYDPKPFMKDFYKISELYTSVFWWIKEKLKKNEQFRKMYNYRIG